MNIKIKSITLRNFKGLRDVSFDFDGRNATIIGDNGTGKTTIFDALTWVLFGKDSHNSTDIDIKTIDATGEPMHREFGRDTCLGSGNVTCSTGEKVEYVLRPFSLD